MDDIHEEALNDIFERLESEGKNYFATEDDVTFIITHTWDDHDQDNWENWYGPLLHGFCRYVLNTYPCMNDGIISLLINYMYFKYNVELQEYELSLITDCAIAYTDKFMRLSESERDAYKRTEFRKPGCKGEYVIDYYHVNLRDLVFFWISWTDDLVFLRNWLFKLPNIRLFARKIRESGKTVLQYFKGYTEPQGYGDKNDEKYAALEEDFLMLANNS